MIFSDHKTGFLKEIFSRIKRPTNIKIIFSQGLKGLIYVDFERIFYDEKQTHEIEKKISERYCLRDCQAKK